MGALFVRRNAQHYYFGDYYDKRYGERGFVAWPEYRVGRTGYDPNYSYYRHKHLAEPRWEASLHELYRSRLSGEVPRPPRTWSSKFTPSRSSPATRPPPWSFMRTSP